MANKAKKRQHFEGVNLEKLNVVRGNSRGQLGFLLHLQEEKEEKKIRKKCNIRQNLKRNEEQKTKNEKRGNLFIVELCLQHTRGHHRRLHVLQTGGGSGSQRWRKKTSDRGGRSRKWCGDSGGDQRVPEL